MLHLVRLARSRLSSFLGTRLVQGRGVGVQVGLLDFAFRATGRAGSGSNSGRDRRELGSDSSRLDDDGRRLERLKGKSRRRRRLGGLGRQVVDSLLGGAESGSWRLLDGSRIHGHVRFDRFLGRRHGHQNRSKYRAMVARSAARGVIEVGEKVLLLGDTGRLVRLGLLLDLESNRSVFLGRDLETMELIGQVLVVLIVSSHGRSGDSRLRLRSGGLGGGLLGLGSRASGRNDVFSASGRLAATRDASGGHGDLHGDG